MIVYIIGWFVVNGKLCFCSYVCKNEMLFSYIFDFIIFFNFFVINYDIFNYWKYYLGIEFNFKGYLILFYFFCLKKVIYSYIWKINFCGLNEFMYILLYINIILLIKFFKIIE